MAGVPIVLASQLPATSQTLSYVITNNGSPLVGGAGASAENVHLYLAERPCIIDSAFAIYDTTQTNSSNMFRAQIKPATGVGATNRYPTPPANARQTTELVSELGTITAFTPVNLQVKEARNAGAKLDNFIDTDDGISFFLDKAGTPANTTAIFIQLRIHFVTSESPLRSTDGP